VQRLLSADQFEQLQGETDGHPEWVTQYECAYQAASDRYSSYEEYLAFVSARRAGRARREAQLSLDVHDLAIILLGLAAGYKGAELLFESDPGELL